MYKKTLLIDLDGVLNTYTGEYQEDYIPPMAEGAKEFLESLKDKYDLKLFTTRPAHIAQKWLQDNNISDLFSDVSNTKSPAWLLVDDRCLTFNGSFEHLAMQIAEFKPWYK